MCFLILQVKFSGLKAGSKANLKEANKMIDYQMKVSLSCKKPDIKECNNR